MKSKSDEYNIANRILLHSKFSTNSTNWFNWIFQTMSIKKGSSILELGAGDGEMWVRNLPFIPEHAKITISDILDEFLALAQERLKNELNDFKFEIIDIHNIPYENKFDKVLANTMIYHSHDLDLAIQQVKKSLVNGGTFYCTTSGLDHLIELKDLVLAYDSSCIFPLNGENVKFSRENGKEILSHYFKNVVMQDFENSLIVDDYDFLIDFILTFQTDPKFYIEPISNEKKEFKKYLESTFKSGQIKVTKSNCIFVAQ